MSLSLKKTPMPEQDALERGRNFKEVTLGYSEEQALTEAARCLQCKTAPCRQGCPVGVDIPGFIGKLKTGDVVGAREVLKEYNGLPAVCGRVCPQEEQCEKYCVLAKKGEAVGIGRLERYTADTVRSQDEPQEETAAADAQKVAVIGSGPAGLTAAGEMAKRGYKVTVFEALHRPGGVLVYGIPEFRLPKEEVVQAEIEALRKLGVDIEVNVVIGQTYTIDELMEEEGFEAVFIATGAGLPHFMGIPGEQYNGVY